MILLLLYLSLALGVSFLCSILEAVLLSVTPSYIAQELKQGKPNGKRWERTKENVDRSLAAILSLNTIAHTVGAAGVGAQATHLYGEAYFGIISAVLTFLILVISEIVPKTLGATFWKQLASPCVRILNVLELAMLPLVIASQAITTLISPRHKRNTVSREEISALAWIGEHQGILSREESEVIRGTVLFRHLTAADVMTPRSVMFYLNDQTTVGEAFADKRTKRFSRIPIYHKDPNNVQAFVRKDDIFMHAANGEADQPIKTYGRPILNIPENRSLLSIWREMMLNHYQMCLVRNENDVIEGLLTLEDLVETMLQLEIVDETDIHPDMRKLAEELREKREQYRSGRP